jgi:uncharacterized membrane protein YccC
MSAIFFGLALLLTFGAPVAMHTGALGDPGPDLLPRIVGICMGVLAVLLFLQGSQKPDSSNDDTESPVTISLSLLAIPAFYLMFEYLGYTIAAGLYLLVAFGLLGVRNRASLLRYALAAMAFSLTTGMVFARLLELPLPGVLP